MSAPAPGAWVKCLARRPSAQWRLVCLAHAGGGPAAFTHWPRLLPEWVEVHAVLLPGRMARIREAPITNFSEMMAALAPAVRALCDRPVALFGHSLGALLAFETARAWRQDFNELPQHLFVSGAPSPHLPRSGKSIHDLPEHEFQQRVRAFGGTPPEVWNNDELRELVLPVLRADFALGASYRYQPMPPLDCPITALGGTEDPSVSVAALQAWRAQTSGPFEMRLFPGGHFFIQSLEAAVAEVVAKGLMDEGK